ncbi:acetate--CoA ligase family protein [Sphingomonas sp. 37zxx]|uniref:acetate--CoA ligase family protein n=1 Tax=Sphingomonas sp. 37zxx TaxID=1550073 RepID=UPI00053C0649|nr:acetate--CoA ligase family protein [Sphingomonas sp. 37zxx]
MTDINRLLRPRSIAIVGASDKPGALGATVLDNLERCGFAGAIHLINPKRSEIGPRPCLPSIDALPDGVDVAVLAIPRAGVVDAVRLLGARGVGAAVIFSAGFAEGGEEGMAEQREIARIAAQTGMVVEGPNCLGLVNYRDSIPLTFIETHPAPPRGEAGVAVVSQSGAMAAVLSGTLIGRAVDVTFSISTGNEAASGVEDHVEAMLADDATRVIALIVEQFRQPRRFLALAGNARAAGKHLVLLHPGKSSAARESAATHTGAMAGDYAVMRALVTQAGVVFAETLEELGDIAEILARCGPLAVGGLAVVGESGALKAMALDQAEALGLDLPAMTDADSPALRAVLPPFVGVSNPVDITAQALVEPELYARTIDALAADPRISAVLVQIIQTDERTVALKLPAILRAIEDVGGAKPVLFAGVDEEGPMPPAFLDRLRALGSPYFPTAERVLRAVARLGDAATVPAARVDPLPDLPLDLGGEAGVVPEYRAKALLADVGIAFPRARLATTVDEAVSAAAALGYPVVLKAQSADLPHKSEAGGVILGLADAGAVAAAWDRMQANVTAYDRDIQLAGILVEAMGKRGTEMIVGARRDPDWGPVVLAGFGGVQAEILKDVCLILPTASRDAIARSLHHLRSAPLLRGWRGAPPLDVEALALLVERLAAVMQSNPGIAEIDLNPVILGAAGEGALALDALMLIEG